MTKRREYYKVIGYYDRCSIVADRPGWRTNYPVGKTVKAKFGSFLFVFDNKDDAEHFAGTRWEPTRVVRCHAKDVRRKIYKRDEYDEGYVECQTEQNEFWKNASMKRFGTFSSDTWSWPKGTLWAKEVTCLE